MIPHRSPSATVKVMFLKSSVAPNETPMLENERRVTQRREGIEDVFAWKCDAATRKPSCRPSIASAADAAPAIRHDTVGDMVQEQDRIGPAVALHQVEHQVGLTVPWISEDDVEIVQGVTELAVAGFAGSQCARSSVSVTWP